MHFILSGLAQAWHLIVHPDAQLRSVVTVTLELAFGSTVVALLLGVPLGLTLGIGRFRGRRVALVAANGGFGLPPVLVGLVVFLLISRSGPLGALDLVYTVPGMVAAQTLLNLPIVVAIVATGAQAVSPNLLEQSRALGASFVQSMLLAMAEARVSVMVVGGNIDLQTQTIAGAILTTVAQGRYSEAIALGVILLGVVLVLAALATLVKHGRRKDTRAAHRIAT